METDIERLYQKIGYTIAQFVPEPWQTASVDVSIKDTVVTMQGTYVLQNDQTQHSFPVPGSISRMFVQLQQLIKKDDQHLWTNARFTIYAKGDFTVEFGYSDIGKRN